MYLESVPCVQNDFNWKAHTKVGARCALQPDQRHCSLHDCDFPNRYTDTGNLMRESCRRNTFLQLELICPLVPGCRLYPLLDRRGRVAGKNDKPYQTIDFEE